MRHTQGKWEVTGQSENSRYITVKSDNGRTVARVPWNSEKEVEQGICTDTRCTREYTRGIRRADC